MRLRSLLLLFLVLALASPAAASWVKPEGITGLGATIKELKPATPDAKPGVAEVKDGTVLDILEAASGKVVVKSDVIEQEAGTSGGYMALPLFRVASADVMSGDQNYYSLLTMHKLEDKFIGQKPSDLRVKKFRSKTGRETFEFVGEAVKIGNGKFAILQSNGKTLLPVTETISTGCYIALCVQRDGNFDIGSGDYVIDPSAVYYTTELVPVTGVIVTPPVKVIAKDDTFTFTAEVAPADASNKAVTWASSDETVATIDEDGKATGLVDGETTITATTNDGGKTNTATLHVGVPVTSVTVTPASATIGVGGTVSFSAAVQPDDATISEVTWSSGDEGVATVSAKGLVTGVGSGTAVITATSADGNDKKGQANVAVSSFQPVIPEFPLPPGFEAPQATLPATIAESGLNDAAAETVELASSAGHYLTLKKSVLENNLSHLGNSVVSGAYLKLPVFTASVSEAGVSAVFLFPLPVDAPCGPQGRPGDACEGRLHVRLPIQALHLRG